MLFRERMVKICEESSPLSGEVEVDESYFGASRVRRKRGRGARGKTIVFGLFKREGKVYIDIVSDITRATLQGIIQGKVNPDSIIIHFDGWGEGIMARMSLSEVILISMALNLFGVMLK